jgi:hypothetical protein
MTDAVPASLTFLPWVRQGAASLIANLAHSASSHPVEKTAPSNT